MVATRRRQRGQSLISMMIGLVISLITIAAMLTLYKTMVGVSNEASVAARRDGQMAAGLLAAQMELQSAGFGVDSTVPLDERLYISNSGKQVAWLYNDGSRRCAGLWVDGNGLYRLPPKAGCASASGATWSASERIPMALMPTAADGSLITFSGEQGGASVAGYAFSREEANRACLPYMQQDLSDMPASTAQWVALTNATGTERLFSICLPNLTVVSASPPAV